MNSDFIPIDYDYFDFEGRNYARIIGRNSKGKRLCVIDSCDVYLWAILKPNIAKPKIDKLIKKPFNATALNLIILLKKLCSFFISLNV